jgi:hypothetical protein
MAVLKNIQSGVKSFTGTSDSITIDSVVTSKTIIFVSSSTDTTQDGPGAGLFTAHLSNSTTISLSRDNNTGTHTIRWYAVEFESGVNVQRGTINLTSTSQGVTLSTVTVSQSWATITLRNLGTAYGNDDMVRGIITSATNLQLQVASAGTGGVDLVAWQVIDYDDATVQQISTGTTTATSNNQSISTIDIAKSFIVGASYTTTNCGANDMFRFYINSSTQVSFTRYAGASVDFNAYVVEIGDSGFSSQRGQGTLASGSTSATPMLTGVDTDRSIGIIGGVHGYLQNNNSTGEEFDKMSFSIYLSSSTQATLTRGASGQTATYAWEVLEFPSGVRIPRHGFSIFQTPAIV